MSETVDSPQFGDASELASPLLSVRRRPRILDREGRFSQSRGRWSVLTTERGVSYRRGGQPPAPPTNDVSLCAPRGNGIRSCWDDWFHNISYAPTFLLLGIIFLAYSATIVVFAGMYYAVNQLGVAYGHGGLDAEIPPETTLLESAAVEGQVDSFCGMDIDSFMEALYFSLSTMATIGYGSSDYYFGNCWTPFLLVLFQVFSALAFSSLAIGLLFQRISRGQKRGRTIVFSDISILRKVRGQWYWMFRVAELRKRHIIGAKVRVFCVRHERCPVKGGGKMREGAVELETAYFVSRPLVLGGGTEAGSGSRVSSRQALEGKSCGTEVYEESILMGLPQVVVHRMDDASPMMPPRPVWYDETGLPHSSAVSGNQGNDNEQSTTPLLASIEEGSSSVLLNDAPSQGEIASFFQDRQAEIIVCLEGTCEVTGMTLQVRHSYKFEDIAFHSTFAPCVFPAPASSRLDVSEKKWWKFDISKAKVDDYSTEHASSMSFAESEGFSVRSPALEVDFGRFHELMPAPLDCWTCPYVPAFV